MACVGCLSGVYSNSNSNSKQPSLRGVRFCTTRDRLSPQPMRMTAAGAQRHAVCLTGLQRAFPVIGSNVRAFLLDLVSTLSRRYSHAELAIFGVRPRNDAWWAILRLLPLQRVEAQWDLCIPWYNASEIQRWYHCNSKGRTHCELNFLQTWCDLWQCEAMIARHERSSGRNFDVVHRLRADIQYEATLLPEELPQLVRNDTVYVPFMGNTTGVNDQAAFGGRWAMRQYLTRVSHLLAAGPTITVDELQRDFPHRLVLHRGRTVASEELLRVMLHRDGVRYAAIRSWAYCLHTFRALLQGSSLHGCIARARWRTKCTSLVCPAGAANGCTCHNKSCTVLSPANAPAPLVSSVGPGQDPTKHRRVTSRDACIDLYQGGRNGSRQLLLWACAIQENETTIVDPHPQPPSHFFQRGCVGPPCDWRPAHELAPHCTFTSGGEYRQGASGSISLSKPRVRLLGA